MAVDPQLSMDLGRLLGATSGTYYAFVGTSDASLTDRPNNGLGPDTVARPQAAVNCTRGEIFLHDLEQVGRSLRIWFENYQTADHISATLHKKLGLNANITPRFYVKHINAHGYTKGGTMWELVSPTKPLGQLQGKELHVVLRACPYTLVVLGYDGRSKSDTTRVLDCEGARPSLPGIKLKRFHLNEEVDELDWPLEADHYECSVYGQIKLPTRMRSMLRSMGIPDSLLSRNTPFRPDSVVSDLPEAAYGLQVPAPAMAEALPDSPQIMPVEGRGMDIKDLDQLQSHILSRSPSLYNSEGLRHDSDSLEPEAFPESSARGDEILVPEAPTAFNDSESPHLHDIREVLDERPVQPANPSSIPTPSTLMSRKEGSTGIDQATSILQGAIITAPSADAFGRDPQASPSFPNGQLAPPQPPNLTGRIVRLGFTALATGGYSSVWRGSLRSAAPDNPDQALQVAIKVLRASHTDEYTIKRKLLKRLNVEMRIWAQLHHENVVRLLGHTQEPEGPGLVSMLYLHGNVLGFLAKNPSANREVICADVALGLQYLHEHEPPIIHGDLKGPNVLIDAEGRASICDFGLSIILDGGPTGHTSSNFGGTLRFLAPELLTESAKTVKTDIYTYACTCIQILFDQEPFHHLPQDGHVLCAMYDRRPPIEPSNKEVTFPLFWRILKPCWDHDRWKRPSLNLIIDTIQHCLYRTARTNSVIHQGIGRRVRFMCLPAIEQANLVSVADGGLSIVVHSGTSFHRVPIYQRYRWEFMDTQDLEVSEHDVFLSHEASLSESPPYVSEWKDYSAKFRLPYSSMVSYELYNDQ